MPLTRIEGNIPRSPNSQSAQPAIPILHWLATSVSSCFGYYKENSRNQNIPENSVGSYFLGFVLKLESALRDLGSFPDSSTMFNGFNSVRRGEGVHVSTFDVTNFKLFSPVLFDIYVRLQHHTYVHIHKLVSILIKVPY